MGKNATSVFGIVVAPVLGALIAWAGSDNGQNVGGLRIMVVLALVAFGIQLVAFVPSYLAQTENYFDITGSVTYVTLVVLAVVLSDDVGARDIIILALVVIWAGRLGSFLFARARRAGGDTRFVEITPDPLRFAMMWMVQGLWVFLTLAAGLAAITARDDDSFGWVAIVGVVVWVIGFGIEVVADQQKKAFRADGANKGRFITTGLWAWSRHPNYAGEIILWAGIALIALPALSGWQYVCLISPVFVYLLLTRISGLPMLESQAKKRWGDEPEYREYKKNTPAIWLRPPRG